MADSVIEMARCVLPMPAADPIDRPTPSGRDLGCLTAVNAKFPLGFGRQDIDGDWMPVEGLLEKPMDLQLLPAKVEALLSGARPGACCGGS